MIATRFNEHFVFIIDDYHLIRDCKSIEPLLTASCKRWLKNCHFIMASRVLLTQPDLSLLVARNQVAGLSFEELAFLPEEVKQLISVNFHQTITDERAEELVSQTEGWITGLLLSTPISTRGTEDRIRLAKVSGIGVYEYLAQQVFDRQSEEMQKFLLRTSLLEEFSVQLCNKVIGHSLNLGRYPWQEMVNQILRDNLFVLSVGEETQFLRYHHLFRDFLQNRMRLQFPEESAKIERTLAKNCIEQHLWEQAYAILSRLGDEESILKLIYDAAPFMINSGKLITLSNWLEQVPAERLQKAPELISIQATILLVRGDVAASIKLLDRAIEGLKKSSKEIDLGRSLNRRSIANNHLGNYNESLKDADQAITLTENKPGLESIRAEAFRMRGLSLFQQGDLLGSLDALNNSRYLFESFGNKEDIAGVLMELGLPNPVGNFDSAEKSVQDALERWQTSGNLNVAAKYSITWVSYKNLRGQSSRLRSHLNARCNFAPGSLLAHGRVRAY
jgi:ATP/maltotriose-dependent transcriptional regulator MalT